MGEDDQQNRAGISPEELYVVRHIRISVPQIATKDWYNLEKSKRVKPFRCGEFDACIEKAEASYSTPIKRREKYARREDAILHALELERQQREIKQESTTAGNMILSICERDSNHYTSEILVQSRLSNQKSHNSSRKVTPLLDEYYLDHPLLLHRNRQVKPENDKHEITTHMRVEDVGAEFFESKGKLIHSVSGANSFITDESQLDLLPQSGHNSVFITQAANCKNFSIPKRKSLLAGSINDTIPKRKSLGAINDTPTKRRDRRRPLVKVLQSSIKLPVSYSLQPHHDSCINTIPGEENHADITHGAQKDITVYSSHDAEDRLYYSRNLLKQLPDYAGNAYQLQHSGCMSNESTPSGWTEGNEFDSSATDSELEIVEEKLRSGN
ncbi:hypothetical protein KSP39_PZI014999 [Platanthera zijinensis]|uniref:Uncharacterized protein n=1 Tax=Platanthera zijinensis TaxID=2320716 RepID=A0AAP0G2F4_9ASPA